MTGVIHDDIERFTESMRIAGLAPDALTIDESGTLFVQRPPLPEHARPLPRIVGTGVGNGAGDDDVVLHEPISRGGMGEILRADQRSLGRTVVVKRSLHRDDDDVVVIEGRITGALEHPNIVPVHALGLDGEGRPLLVMKRVEGRTWSQVRRDGDDLDRDVEILQHVCRALHFAHARGVVHRDVKPANVMIGRFGEVYLLDWGIAVGVASPSVASEQTAQVAHAIVGTPHYMAPEMATPGAVVDARADVYLVGAVLFEILCGRPLRSGDSTLAMIHAAHRGDVPPLPDDAPDDLKAICLRALQRNPDDRFASADELRLALAQFPVRRAARALVDEGVARLAALRALPDDADATVAQRTFDEGRFAFVQALRAWPDATRAREGLHGCLIVMARRELALGHLDAVRLLATELASHGGALPDDVDDAVAALEHERAAARDSARALAELQHDTDASVSGRARGKAAAVVGAGTAVIAIVLAVLSARDVFHQPLVVLLAYALLNSAVLASSARSNERLSQNAVGRSAVNAMVLASFAQTAWYALAASKHVDTAAALAGAHVVLALGIGVTGAFVPGLGRATFAAAAGVFAVAAAGSVGEPAALVASAVAGTVPFALLPSLTRRTDDAGAARTTASPRSVP